ncbi:MAG TPA: glutathione S-transferase [Xanthobacteraceae bacterium]|nr:glutathione S-transferase [Xanthobacteraceae bacterium]
MPLVVHHLNNSRAQRVLWLLEELGVPYEVKHHQRIKLQAPPELKAIHPLGKSPIVEDRGHTFAETGAIVEYVLEAYANGRLRPPPGSDERLRFTYWLHYAEGSAMPPLLIHLMFALMPRRSPALLRPLVRRIAERSQAGYSRPQLKLHMDFWESELGRSTWFAGEELTAADIMMSYPVEAAAARAKALEGRPRLAAFLERVHARPAYARAVARGGPVIPAR